MATQYHPLARTIRSIATYHNGDHIVVSASMQNGTTAEMTLPTRTARQQAEATDFIRRTCFDPSPCFIQEAGSTGLLTRRLRGCPGDVVMSSHGIVVARDDLDRMVVESGRDLAASKARRRMARPVPLPLAA